MRFLTRFVLALLFVVVGLGLLGEARDLEDINLHQWLERPPWLQEAVGTGFGVAGLLLLLTAFYQARPEASFVIESTEGNTVVVTFSAIEDFIRGLGSRVEGVKSLRPRVRASKRTLELVNRIDVEKNANIPEINVQLQDLVRRELQGTMGISDVRMTMRYERWARPRGEDAAREEDLPTSGDYYETEEKKE